MTEKFSIWYKGSKHCQVVIPDNSWEQIAKDGWDESRRATLLEVAGLARQYAADGGGSAEDCLDALAEELERMAKE